MSRWVSVLLCMALAGLCVAAPKRAYVIRGRRVQVVPKEALEKLGLKRAVIPPERNAAWPLLEAAERWVSCPKKLGKSYTKAQKAPWGDELAALRPWLARQAPNLRLVRQAVERPELQFPILSRDGRVTSLFAALMPQLSGLRNVGRTLVARGHGFEGAGKMREALADYLLALRLGRKLAPGDFLITGLVGLAVERIGAQALTSFALRGRADAAALARLAAELERIGAQPVDWARTMVAEQAAAEHAISFYATLGANARVGRFGRWIVPLLRSRAWRIAWPDRIMASECRAVYDKLRALGKRPPWEAVRESRVLFGRGRRMGAPAGVSSWNFLARMLLPALGRVVAQYVESMARFEASRIVTAMRRYQMAEGQWPAGLADLAPRFLKQVPLDPFTGKPFRYRKRARGWRLYSVGKNLKDDGGRRRADVVIRFPLKEAKR